MFSKLAKFRSFGLWPTMPRLEAVRSEKFHCNDNPPGFRRPESRGLRPKQALACHWSLSRDGRRLECRWELAARSSGGQEPLAHMISPRLVPSGDPIDLREAAAA